MSLIDEAMIKDEYGCIMPDTRTERLPDRAMTDLWNITRTISNKRI